MPADSYQFSALVWLKPNIKANSREGIPRVFERYPRNIAPAAVMRVMAAGNYLIKPE